MRRLLYENKTGREIGELPDGKDVDHLVTVKEIVRCAVVDNKKKVVNVVEAPVDFPVGDGLTLIPSETASPGDMWNGKKFETRPTAQ